MVHIDKRIIKDYIDVGFPIDNIKQVVVKDKDDNDHDYKKTISYMENHTRTRKGLILLIHSKSVQVARVVDYI